MMLKTDSNLQEIYEFLRKNKGRMAAQGPKAAMMWCNQLKKSKGMNTTMFYEYEVEGHDCYFFQSGNSEEYYFSNIITVPFAKDKNQYVHWYTKTMEAMKYTSHFFDRYKERMKVKGSMKQTVKQFFKKSKSMICIYRKHGHVVYVMDDGLVLGVEDERLVMHVCCTFVDYGLLKNSQRAAFDKIQPVMKDIWGMYVDMKADGISTHDASEIIGEKFDDVREAAANIYSWYFEEGDLRTRVL